MNRNFRPTYQDNPKPAKWDATFQAQGLDGRAIIEAFKKLSAYGLIKINTTATYSRRVMQQNPHIKERLEEKTNPAKITDDNPSEKEIV